MGGAEQHNDEWRSHLYFQAPLRKPNGDIRLLTIQPRQYAASIKAPDNAIHCFLRLASVKQSLDFIAVSHKWDPADGSKSAVLVNGASVPVSTGVFDVLEHLQQDAQPTTIWINTLCINQEDLSEKSAQVLQLAAIYGAASKTLIWLGNAADGSDEAMDALKRVVIEHFSQSKLISNWTPEIGQRLFKGVVSKGASQETVASNSSPRSKASTNNKSSVETQLGALRGPLEALLNRPYWLRLWSISEMALSAKGVVACGNRRIELERFLVAIKSLDSILNMSTVSKWLEASTTPASSSGSRELHISERASYSRSPSARLLEEREFYRKGAGSWFRNSEHSLLSLLNHSYVLESDYYATLDVVDPRDRVYDLLSLSSDASLLGITPDYNKELEQVYVETSTALLRSSIRTLQLSQGIERSNKNLPSWAIDWNHVRKPPSDAVAHDRPFLACGPADDRFCRVDTSIPGQVSLRGATVDTIRTVANTYVPDEPVHLEHCRSYLSEVKTLWGESLESDHSPYSIEQTMVALAKIPVADTEIHEGRTQRAATLTVEGYRNALESLSEENSTDPDSGREEENTGQNDRTPTAMNFAGATEYMAAVAKMGGRRPFLSETGYVGLGPSGLEPGDTIAIPYGSRVPFALRHQTDDTYQVVGELYVYGIMDGEFMKVHRKETVLRLT
ncbi:heterokaryon incompatibility protein-domain-containing protein [Xylariaceae sp. FL0662B]|nr:heterokaryon incompatibility protein-domain-containing protein [Xylariaceae sp. FL0662B]